MQRYIEKGNPSLHGLPLYFHILPKKASPPTPLQGERGVISHLKWEGIVEINDVDYSV